VDVINAEHTGLLGKDAISVHAFNASGRDTVHAWPVRVVERVDAEVADEGNTSRREGQAAKATNGRCAATTFLEAT